MIADSLADYRSAPYYVAAVCIGGKRLSGKPNRRKKAKAGCCPRVTLCCSLKLFFIVTHDEQAPITTIFNQACFQLINSSSFCQFLFFCLLLSPYTAIYLLLFTFGSSSLNQQPTFQVEQPQRSFFSFSKRSYA